MEAKNCEKKGLLLVQSGDKMGVLLKFCEYIKDISPSVMTNRDRTSGSHINISWYRIRRRGVDCYFPDLHDFSLESFSEIHAHKGTSGYDTRHEI